MAGRRAVVARVVAVGLVLAVVAPAGTVAAQCERAGHVPGGACPASLRDRAGCCHPGIFELTAELRASLEAAAIDPPRLEARTRLEDARRYLLAARFGDAAASFEQAYQALAGWGHPQAFVLFGHAGRAWDAGGDFPRAIEAYTLYLQRGGSALTDAADVTRRLGELRAWVEAGRTAIVGAPLEGPTVELPTQRSGDREALDILTGVAAMGAGLSYFGTMVAMAALAQNSAGPSEHLGWAALPWVGPFLVFTGGDAVTDEHAAFAITTGVLQVGLLTTCLVAIAIATDGAAAAAHRPLDTAFRIDLAPRLAGFELSLTATGL